MVQLLSAFSLHIAAVSDVSVALAAALALAERRWDHGAFLEFPQEQECLLAARVAQEQVTGKLSPSILTTAPLQGQKPCTKVQDQSPILFLKALALYFRCVLIINMRGRALTAEIETRKGHSEKGHMVRFLSGEFNNTALKVGRGKHAFFTKTSVTSPHTQLFRFLCQY